VWWYLLFTPLSLFWSHFSFPVHWYIPLRNMLHLRTRLNFICMMHSSHLMLLSKITYLEVVNLPCKCLAQRRTIRCHLESVVSGVMGAFMRYHLLTRNHELSFNPLQYGSKGSMWFHEFAKNPSTFYDFVIGTSSCCTCFIKVIWNSKWSVVSTKPLCLMFMLISLH
jgi:hypothetical protein